MIIKIKNKLKHIKYNLCNNFNCKNKMQFYVHKKTIIRMYI